MSGRGGGRGLSSRTTQFVIISGVGVGTLFYLFRRIFWRQAKGSVVRANGTPAALTQPEVRPESNMSYARHTPSERGSALPPSTSSRVPRVRHSTISSTVPPLEADLVVGLETCQELTKNLERAFTNLELVRNRSDKDRNRAEMVQSVLDRLKVLETDIQRLVADGGSGAGDDYGSVSSILAGYQSPRAGTLSVLSDDSFMSAFEDFPPNADEDIGEDLEIDRSTLVLYETGLERATAGEVFYRKPRAEFTQCESETEFAAKVYCLREAFEVVLKDEHRRLWLAKSGRQLLGDIMKHSKQDPKPFYKAFDDMMEFCGKEQNQDMIAKELASRGVVVVSFWDVLLDFMLLDAFDDLKNPPSAIFSVTRNYFLSQSMKYSTISTIVWSMLKKKRQRLIYAEGFIAHFYNISETVSPAITLGFLGTDDVDQIQAFVLDIFNLKRVRYTSIEDLADDIWIQLEQRTELVLTRLSSELIPI
ncbi:hypothetical protein PRIPAC_73910 [Pristionchus pacificus]|uniref:Uncharacterized protein n=1 Tax=Pristionchus pacificus TaxID=54126 RepID=A0A2A6D0E9_PRIPA|nr:hypothetical protein PRIPAC_73910 [Pristionchus pacificus]|eukprot:PDM83869.1 hypothetical protein PRIPAC_30356 [Pristionchus pacificus]